MIRIILFLSITLISFLSACKKEADFKRNQLTGAWEEAFAGQLSIHFAADSLISRYRNGELVGTPNFEKDSSGQLVETNYGPLYFKVDQISNDSIQGRILGSTNQKVFSKNTFILNGDYLTEIRYKTLPGIENHIDEVQCYQRAKSTKSISRKVKQEKIIFPQGLEGFIYIAYGQKDGQKIELDEHGNRILTIPKNGILKTQAIEDPEILATDQFVFYEKDSLSGVLRPYPVYQHGAFRKTAIQLKNQESVTLKYPAESMAMFVWGFNQTGRKRVINKVFGEIIEGNVLSLEIDTVGERLRLDWYTDKIKH